MNALKCLIQLSNFGSVSSYLAKYNTIKYILQGLEKYKDNALFCAFACKAIWSLSTYGTFLSKNV